MIIPFNTPRYFRMPDGTKVLVKEAWFDLPVIPTAEDIAAATPGDPYNCMYAVNIKRVWNAAFVAVERGICGAVLPDKNGKLRFYRWIVSARVKANIKDFDDGENFPPHAVMMLRPKGSQTLAAKALAHTKWELEQARSKRKKGPAKKEKPAPSKPKRKAHASGSKEGLSADQLEDVAAVGTLRKSGKGMFQFRPVIAQE